MCSLHIMLNICILHRMQQFEKTSKFKLVQHLNIQIWNIFAESESNPSPPYDRCAVVPSVHYVPKLRENNVVASCRV